MTTYQISILRHHINLGINPLISLISNLGPQRLTKGSSMLQSQIDPVDISTVHVVPEVHAHDCGHLQGWTEESGRFVVVHASLCVDVVTRLAPCSVVKWRASAWWSGAPRVTSPVQILRLVLLPVTEISLKVTTQQRSCKSNIVIIPSESMSIHVKKKHTNYVYISMQRLLYGDRKQCIIITCWRSRGGRSGHWWGCGL